jgi:hypothetical protein
LILGDAFEGKATIQANHMDMCRFRDQQDHDYQLVAGVIRRRSRMTIELGSGESGQHDCAPRHIPLILNNPETNVNGMKIVASHVKCASFFFLQSPARHFRQD